MTLQQIKKRIESQKDFLKTEFAVSALYVFGSVARGEEKKTSDVDFLVEFLTDDVDLFQFVDLKFYLESILKIKVDLVTRDAVHKRMIVQIEKDSIRVA